MGNVIAICVIFSALVLGWAADSINNKSVRIFVMVVVAVLDCIGFSVLR